MLLHLVAMSERETEKLADESLRYPCIVFGSFLHELSSVAADIEGS